MDNNFRSDFPFFSQDENRNLIYFDNAATSQRPKAVLDALNEFYIRNNANPLRGLYGLSVRATEDYENARRTVANFLGAADSAEIIFTRNASESLNLIAYTWGIQNISEGDEIVVSIMEHHSNILPWQMLCRAKGAVLKFMECDRETGEIPDSELSKITPRTKLVSVTHISNVLGIMNDVVKIGAEAHRNGAVFVVDGAQSVPHMKIDVRKTGADFLAFSGHKACGPMGCGVLYGRKELLEQMPPFLRGGEMIEYVTRDSATWAELPHKFEAGTVNAAGAVALAAALDYLENSVTFDFIRQRDEKLSELMMARLSQIPHLHIIGSRDHTKHSGIFSFTIDGVHPHDTATVLDSENIAIRAGHHCAQPLGEYLGLPATARASLYFYNTEEEVDRFANAVANVRRWMGFSD